MFEPLANLMAWFYEIWPSYGGMIILLTLTVMLVLTPLTLRGTKSMLRMQQLQPEMKRIQKENKDDRQRQNEELIREATGGQPVTLDMDGARRRFEEIGEDLARSLRDLTGRD